MGERVGFYGVVVAVGASLLWVASASSCRAFDAAPTSSGRDAGLASLDAAAEGGFDSDPSKIVRCAGPWLAPVTIAIPSRFSAGLSSLRFVGPKAYIANASNGLFNATLGPDGNLIGPEKELMFAAAAVTVRNHPFVLDDELTLLFQGQIEPGIVHLWQSTRPSVASGWSDAKQITIEGITTGKVLEPWVESGLLYFGNEETEGDEDLFVARRTEGGWVGAERLDAISADEAEDGFPVVTSDGRTIYFESNRDGNHDIYQSTKAQRSDEWVTATKVPELSTGDDDRPTWISNDDCTLIVIRKENTTFTTVRYSRLK